MLSISLSAIMKQLQEARRKNAICHAYWPLVAASSERFICGDYWRQQLLQLSQVPACPPGSSPNSREDYPRQSVESHVKFRDLGIIGTSLFICASVCACHAQRVAVAGWCTADVAWVTQCVAGRLLTNCSQDVWERDWEMDMHRVLCMFTNASIYDCAWTGTQTWRLITAT